jgi:hypothetical protein
MSDEISGRPDESPALAEKFAGKAHDLDAARRSVEDAASISTGLWLSYLFVLVYIGIAAGAVTHQDLLLENPVKLPFLSDVPLPLVAFFVLAPIVFIVSHAYTLVHFVMLAAKVGVFETELKNQVGGAAETKEYLRWQLPSNIFVQSLAGPARMRSGGLGLLLHIIAWVSLVVAPVLLLLLIQVQFLPYHHERVTWLVHRCAVLADLALLWALWPSVVKTNSETKRPRPWHHPVFMLASLCALGLAFTAATFPGEKMEQWIGKRQWIPPNPVTAWLGQTDPKNQYLWSSFHDLLFNGRYDETSQRRISLFSNTLVLPEFDAPEAVKIGDPKKLAAAKQSLVLRGRHLEGAVFRGANLRMVILENAHLEGAILYQAQLQGAGFYNANLQGASLYQAKLQCASFDSAHLQGAWLEGAELQGARLAAAQLQGASLASAKLQMASLEMTQLQGASLFGAEFQGANFQGSILADTNLRGASAWRTSFKDVSFATAWEDEEGLKERALPSHEFVRLKADINGSPETQERTNALKHIEELDPGKPGNEATTQKTFVTGPKDHKDYPEALARRLHSLACSDNENAPYIVRGFITNGRLKETHTKAAELVDAILKPDCPVSAALTEQDQANLRVEAKQAQAGASEQ